MKFNPLNGPIARWAASLGLVLFGLGAGAAQGARQRTTHTVTIDASRFEPELSAISAGDTAVWINKDIIPHTATSQAGGFDSGEIAPGKSWKYTARQKGEFPYLCTFHPTMKAILRVK
jgi:plastocyanin